jgi:hypothetical protein
MASFGKARESLAEGPQPTRYCHSGFFGVFGSLLGTGSPLPAALLFRPSRAEYCMGLRGEVEVKAQARLRVATLLAARTQRPQGRRQRAGSVRRDPDKR